MTNGANFSMAADVGGMVLLFLLVGAAALFAFGEFRLRLPQRVTGRAVAEIWLKAFGWLLAPVWLVLFVTILWMLPDVIAHMAQSTGDDMRWYVLAFVGLITSLGGLVAAPLAIIRVQTTERQTRIAEQGHMTDRISKAVEQLGAEKTVRKDGEERSEHNIEVRIGAILSLERIAQDSTTYDKGRDHVRVMEILCAYVRENAPASAAKDHDIAELPDLPDDADAAARADHRKKLWARIDEIEDWARALRPPGQDIALALRVIGRRNAQQRRAEARWGPEAPENAEWVFDRPCPDLPEPADGAPHPRGAIGRFRKNLFAWQQTLRAYRGYRLDLRGTNLRRADLSDLTLSGALFQDARMEGANLGEARMEGADLTRARMEGAKFPEARMEGADLWQARLQGATLWQARMAGATLRQARLEGADLWQARLEGATLREARLEGADLSGARMEEADLRSAHMEGAALRSAQLGEGTELGGASLSGAALRDLTVPPGVLSEDQIAGMFGDGSVILPDDLNRHRPAHWPGAKLDFLNFSKEWDKWRIHPTTYVPPEPPDT